MRPACPDHPGSVVWLDGSYGSPGHRRQRYRCRPADGSSLHRFTEVLPRQRTRSGLCDECERRYAAYEGPQVPRRYRFTARQVAAALYAVGSGESYRSAARAARERAGRNLTSIQPNLVADWVEVFAPVILERYAPSSWPASTICPSRC